MSVQTAIDLFNDWTFLDSHTELEIGRKKVVFQPVHLWLTADDAPGKRLAVRFLDVAALRWTMHYPGSMPSLEVRADGFKGNCAGEILEMLYDDVGMATFFFDSGIKLEFYFRGFEFDWHS